MAMSGAGGAYYRSSSTIPSTLNLHAVNSMHCFVQASIAPSTTNFRGLMELVGSLQNPHEQNIWNHTNSGFYKARAHRRSNDSYTGAQMTSTPSVDTWHSWGSQFTGVNAKIFFNGALEGTGAASAASNANAVYVDALALMTFAGALDVSSNFVEGQIAELAVWNVALTDAEMVSLSKGFRASRIRPQSLIFYAPLVRGLVDKVGGRTMVKQAGADTPSSHPRVFG